ncbi:MAG: hypothetical protein JW903_05860 [Clostridia bacterium]|nr:hypothetical protein [Clostridia bacterium]
MNRKKLLKTIVSLLLSLLIVISTIALISVTVLRTTIFSEKYYLQLLKSDTYQRLVKDAIESDVEAQSSYVGIPSEVLLAGFNDKLLLAQLNEYMINTARYLNFESDIISPSYSADLFLPALKKFLDNDAAANDYIPTANQYSLLIEVADDTSGIIEKHINIFQLNLFKDAKAFNALHAKVYNFSNLGLYILFSWLISIACLFLLHFRQSRKWIPYLLTSLWLSGSIICIPALVLRLLNLVRQLAIDTPYIKYAMETLHNSLLLGFLLPTLLLFMLSSTGLILYIYRAKS